MFPGAPVHFRLLCGAPLNNFPGRKQTVNVFWRGRLQRSFVFTSNREEEFVVMQEDGFLEMSVTPAFSPAALGYGQDARELGVKLVIARR